jgi:hypothetical protein
MDIKSYDINKQECIINFLNVERKVSFSDNGDIDVEPINDLNEQEEKDLFDEILNDEEINKLFPYDS